MLAILVLLPVLAGAAIFAYSYLRFASLIDERLHGQREHSLPRIYGRPMEIRRDQWLSERQLVERLNDLGYAEREKPEKPGEFSARSWHVYTQNSRPFACAASACSFSFAILVRSG